MRFVNNLSLDPDRYLYLYDRDNTRVTKFERDLAYEMEFVVEPAEEVMLTGIYPTAEQGLFLADGTDPSYMRDRDPDPVRVIGLHRPEEGRYSNWIRVPNGRVAFTIIDGEVQG